jgi:hypothetical protein
MKVTDYTTLKVGDCIIVERQPRTWNSTFCKAKPLFQIEFPHTLTIQMIGTDIWDNWAMTCGEYGWDLDGIVKAGCTLIEREYNEAENLIEIL